MLCLIQHKLQHLRPPPQAQFHPCPQTKSRFKPMTWWSWVLYVARVGYQRSSILTRAAAY